MLGVPGRGELDGIFAVPLGGYFEWGACFEDDAAAMASALDVMRGDADGVLDVAAVGTAAAEVVGGADGGDPGGQPQDADGENGDGQDELEWRHAFGPVML